LLFIFGLHRHFRGIRSGRCYVAPDLRIELKTAAQTKLVQGSKATFAVAEATEGACVRSQKEIQFQAGHATGWLRFPCRA
jgi:hypothetical protein